MSVEAASSSGERTANPASWTATTETGFACGWKRKRPSRAGLGVQRLADDAVGQQPAVLDPGVVVGIAQGHVGAGERTAVGSADDPGQRRGLAELEVVRDVLDVIEEPEELARFVAVGLDPDRAVQALVGEQAVGNVVAAVGEGLVVPVAVQPLRPATGMVRAPALDQGEPLDRPAGLGVGDGAVQVLRAVQGDRDVVRPGFDTGGPAGTERRLVGDQEDRCRWPGPRTRRTGHRRRSRPPSRMPRCRSRRWRRRPRRGSAAPANRPRGPRSGLRGDSVMTCGGIPGVDGDPPHGRGEAVGLHGQRHFRPFRVHEVAGAKSALLVGLEHGQTTRGRADPDTTTVAPATGRPVGLSTVPAIAAPAFMTWTLDRLRASVGRRSAIQPRNSRDG